MQAVSKDLMAMKVTELKELAARGEALSGNKAWLRPRRLHAAIVRAHLEARARRRWLLGFCFGVSVRPGLSVLLGLCRAGTFSTSLQMSKIGLLLAYPDPMP